MDKKKMESIVSEQMAKWGRKGGKAGKGKRKLSKKQARAMVKKRWEKYYKEHPKP